MQGADPVRPVVTRAAGGTNGAFHLLAVLAEQALAQHAIADITPEQIRELIKAGRE